MVCIRRRRTDVEPGAGRSCARSAGCLMSTSASKAGSITSRTAPTTPSAASRRPNISHRTHSAPMKRWTSTARSSIGARNGCAMTAVWVCNSSASTTLATRGAVPGGAPTSELIRVDIFPESMPASLSELVLGWETAFQLERFLDHHDHYARTFRAWGLAYRGAERARPHAGRRPDRAHLRALLRGRRDPLPAARGLAVPRRSEEAPATQGVGRFPSALRPRRAPHRRQPPGVSASSGRLRLPCSLTTTSRTTSTGCGSARR